MNNEPVNPYKAITNTKIEPTVVSYTHPAKTLTDEEVIKIIKRFIGTEPLVHEIKQAILRKAQEK